MTWMTLLGFSSSPLISPSSFTVKAQLKEASPGASERLIRSKLALGNLGSSGTTVKVDLRRQLQHRSRKPSALLVTVQLPTNNMKHTHSHATQMLHSTALPFAGIEIQAELFGRQVWQHAALCNANSGALECWSHFCRSNDQHVVYLRYSVRNRVACDKALHGLRFALGFRSQCKFALRVAGLGSKDPNHTPHHILRRDRNRFLVQDIHQGLGLSARRCHCSRLRRGFREPWHDLLNLPRRSVTSTALAAEKHQCMLMHCHTEQTQNPPKAMSHTSKAAIGHHTAKKIFKQPCFQRQPHVCPRTWLS